MIRILFVCHGNICRSPMAQFILRDMAEKEGLSREISVDSAATTSEEIGNPVYPPAARVLKEHGISCAGHVARKMTRADYGRYDLLIGMDSENIRDMQRICGGDPEGKIRLLLEFAGRQDGEVADPWYTRDFSEAWRDIETGCRGLLEVLRKDRDCVVR